MRASRNKKADRRLTCSVKYFFPPLRFLLVLSVLLISATGFSQQIRLDSLVKKFDNYRKNNLQEKLYVHLDRSFYLAGETLWFKIYDVDGSFHKPLDISKVAYFEIINEDNHPIVQLKVAITNGYGYGSVYIPVSINSGNYRVQAYTHWMKNFNSDGFFHSSITLVNALKSPEPISPTASLQHYDAQFLPEGGNLVGGLKSKVAFRVTNNQGQGIDFDGILLDQDNTIILSFKPLKFGIGSFTFTPSAHQTYTAVIKDANGNTSTYKLPGVSDQGFVISLKDSSKNQVTVTVNSIFNGTPADPYVYLFVHTREIIAFAEVRILQNGKTSFVLNKKDLKEGISHLTLFDAQLQPVAERLYFKQPENKLLLNVQCDQGEYGTRRKVKINLSAENIQRQSTDANLSMAVFRMDSLSNNSHENISSYLMLTSELKGSIEFPEYYLQNPNAETNEALDNLMLTHGWRRFHWSDVVANKQSTISFIPEVRSHFIYARVTDQNGAPAKGITTYLSSPSKVIRLYNTITDGHGLARFETKDFWGSHRIVVQTDILKDSLYHIEVISPFIKNSENSATPLAEFRPEIKSPLLKRSIAMQVQDVYSKENTIVTVNPKIDSVAFYGKADETYYLEDYTRFPVMEEVMREYVKGVMVRKNKGKFRFITLDNINQTVFNENPLILLDGTPVFKVDKIMEFNPLKIKKLEVLDRKYYLGAISFQGVVSYSTYTGDLADFVLDPKAITMDYQGLELQQEFYSPQYENQKQRESRLPDQRTLLYWAPSIAITSNEKKEIEFFTSDLTGVYNIVLQGMTSDGLPGFSETTFKVVH